MREHNHREHLRKLHTRIPLKDFQEQSHLDAHGDTLQLDQVLFTTRVKKFVQLSMFIVTKSTIG